VGRLRGTRSWAQLWEPYLGLDPTLGVAQQVGGWFCVRVPEACTTDQAFRVPVFVGMSEVLCVWAIARWVRRMRMMLLN